MTTFGGPSSTVYYVWQVTPRLASSCWSKVWSTPSSHSFRYAAVRRGPDRQNRARCRSFAYMIEAKLFRLVVKSFASCHVSPLLLLLFLQSAAMALWYNYFNSESRFLEGRKGFIDFVFLQV